MVTKKYKKYHKIKKVLKNANNNLRAIKKGIYGLKVIEFGVITPKQLETARRLISKITKRTGKSIINICFNLPLTKKPLSSRMGKGCGSIDYWISYVKKGKIIIEIRDVSKKIAIIIFKAISHRINVKIKLVQREIIDA